MRLILWIATWIYLIVFFYIFSTNNFSPKSYLYESLKSQLNVESMATLNGNPVMDFTSEPPLNRIHISYYLYNSSYRTLSSKDHYYTIEMSRGDGTPGFTIYEFTQDLPPLGEIKGDYDLELFKALAGGGNNMNVYFNAYKVLPDKDKAPVLISSAKQNLQMFAPAINP